MLFYTTLFVISVIAALIILYLFNALKDAGKAVYRAFLPSSKDSLARHIDDVQYRTTINDTSTPWGWNGNDHGIREHHPKRAAGNAKSGLDAFINQVGNDRDQKARKRAAVSWPYREEKSEFTGKAYKVKRKVTPRKTNSETKGKPWGW